jgi:hypothetical protein
MRCSSVPSSSWSRVNGERGPPVVRRILNGLRVDLWLFGLSLALFATSNTEHILEIKLLNWWAVLGLNQ